MSGLFNDFLKELGIVLELPGLAPDAHGACLLEMKPSKLQLLFEFDDQLVPNTILVSCPVATIAPDQEERIYEASLRLNETFEETLSVKPDAQIVYLHRRIHPQISADDLAPLIDSFLRTAQSLPL